MAIKILLFDTCAILKFFIEEPGSDSVRYMVRNKTLLGLNISVATIARLEFENVLWKKTAHGQLSIPQTRNILQRARGYFRDVFRVRDDDPIPAFKAGKPMAYKEIVKKYGLKIGRDDRDVWHIMCVHNYLRCFGGVSLPKIVTSDPNFKKIIKAEGYGVIDPKEVTPKQLEERWG